MQLIDNRIWPFKIKFLDLSKLIFSQHELFYK